MWDTWVIDQGPITPIKWVYSQSVKLSKKMDYILRKLGLPDALELDAEGGGGLLLFLVDV